MSLACPITCVWKSSKIRWAGWGADQLILKVRMRWFWWSEPWSGTSVAVGGASGGTVLEATTPDQGSDRSRCKYQEAAVVGDVIKDLATWQGVGGSRCGWVGDGGSSERIYSVTFIDGYVVTIRNSNPDVQNRSSRHWYVQQTLSHAGSLIRIVNLW